jgi:site-specific recombinase XerD
MSAPNVNDQKPLIKRYEEYLLSTCGVTSGTCDLFKWHVSKFLTTRFGDFNPVNLAALAPKDVIRYISDLSPRYMPRTRKSAVTALRSFFRWLRLNDQCSYQLLNAVPTVSAPRLSDVPVYLSRAQFTAFLNSIDRDTPVGLRTYAAALCMGRLGLRVGEVVRLSLDDIDWRKGVLCIDKGKGRRPHILPLPSDVGTVIIDYLRRARPRSANRYIFPGSPSMGTHLHRGSLSGNFRQAFKAAGLAVPFHGTRILRHTAASRMLQNGATMKEIADVLGHRSINTTSIYAKVDLATLSRVAMPWPGVHS